jgi:uncharacterized repeat protein (TIGR01451 family)
VKKSAARLARRSGYTTRVISRDSRNELSGDNGEGREQVKRFRPTERSSAHSDGTRATHRGLLLAALLAALAGASVFLLSGALPAGAATPCANSVLAGSNFEIDPDANLVVDGPADCIDWLADGSNSAFRDGVLTKTDLPTGTSDDSFGQGSKEDDPNPTIVTGSIPNNKSDLSTFGLYPEVTATGKFLALFWTRVQSPQGTTNMDFELNQKSCPTDCSSNGITPLRTVGDKLITYDLAQGGTVPTISIRTWTGAAWGAPVDLTAANKALGSINSSTIAAADSGGLGALDPFTFGEAIISFDAVFPNPDVCGAVGSAYMKSRSSDSFQAEIKDFIAPEHVSLTNCTSLTTTAQNSVTLGQPIFDVAHLSGSTLGAGGTITFHLFSDAQCQNEVSTGLTPITVNGDGHYNSGNFTPGAAGTYYWTATYSGDQHNKGSTTACGDANESSMVVAATTLTTNAGGPFLVGADGTVALSDVAHLSGGTSSAGGHITFMLFSDNACSNQVGGDVTIGVNGADGKDYTSPPITVNAPGTYYWVASYSGDPDNAGSSTTCGDLSESPLVLKPHISVSKSPDAQTILVGQTANFTITVTNDGNATLTNVVVTDALAPGCARTSADIAGLASMAPGATITYTCSLANVTASFTNIAVATGRPPVGPDVSAQDTAAVTVVAPATHPAISIVKNPKSQTVTSGGTATFTITVTNTGDVSLTNVTVSDPLSPNCNRTIGTLAPGASSSYTCTRANVTSNFTNVAVASGTAGGTTVTAQDTAPVTAKAAALQPKTVTKVKPKVVSHRKPKATG